MKGSFDVAVVGSGFGGSLTALIARRLGRSVVLLEKGTHPRFAIGESSSPLANLLLEELARRYGLSRILPLAKWGTWQRTYPHIGCGLKRGFTFYSHPLGKPFAADPDRRDQLLVAASPHDEIADTHWYRSDFDHFLVREAQAEGVEYLDRTRLDRITWSGSGAVLDGERPGERLSIRARLVVDVSGPRGFLHRALGLREAPFGAVPATQGLYTHFSDVRRLEDTKIFPSKESPPYPVDDAALHHIFDGGWIWVLRFNNGITSAGVAATDRLSHELCLADGAAAWDRLTAQLPTVREQFAQARPLLPFIHAPRLPFRSERAAGPSWAMLPSAAAFVDPLLSTGFPLTLLGIQRLARAVEEDWNSPRFASRLDDHAGRTFFEVEAAARLVGALYANFHDFPLFAVLSLLYFAAASFAETARRLSRPELAGSFLCGDHALFGPAFRRCCESALRGAIPGGLAPDQRDALIQEVFQAIEPLDVVGLSDLSRRNWYPVDARDLLRSADKLGVSREDIEGLLSRSGFFPMHNQARNGEGKKLFDLSIADLPRFKSSFIAHHKRAWCYYVPFLLSYSLPPDRPLTWGLCENSLCLFVRRRANEGERTDLMIPPLPCSDGALSACLDLAGRQNPDGCMRVLWADAEDADRLRASGFEVAFKEEEYLYDPSAIAGAAGRPFRDLRKKTHRFEREYPHVFRRMTASDRDGCEELLRAWRRSRKRAFLLDWGYTRAALRLVGQLRGEDLSGWVVEIEGETRAFALAGEMGDELASFFVAKSDPSVRGLSEFLRWSVCREMRQFSRLNDAGDLGLPGLRQHKLKFRPVERTSVYSAQKRL